jgi:hypothetical protein
MGPAKKQKERRQHSRFPLGLPVRLKLAGGKEAITVELMDISAGGGRFRFGSTDVRLHQGAAFAFIVPEQRRCVARGKVVRVEGPGQFAISLDHANDAFLRFVGLLE